MAAFQALERRSWNDVTAQAPKDRGTIWRTSTHNMNLLSEKYLGLNEERRETCHQITCTLHTQHNFDGFLIVFIRAVGCRQGKMYFPEDEQVARSLQNSIDSVQFNQECRHQEKENYKPNDSILELIDPTPSIHDLFVRFDKNFFWSSLGMVQVLWSNRMTKCAGICYFEGKQGLCKISLSAPLLSLRPRKDLVETLLHEMIHAYLFVTNNYRDRDDHGLEFQKHMNRINMEAGTNISVYHTFHDEVEYYQRHIWRCDGPCRFKKPFFGFVKRAMNRAPGPNDTWWNQHKMECNGNFIKVSEPEKKVKKLNKTKNIFKKSNSKDIRDLFKNKVDNEPESLKTVIVSKGLQVKSIENDQRNLISVSENTVREGNEAHNEKLSNAFESDVLQTKISLMHSDDSHLRDRTVRDFVRNVWSTRYNSQTKVSSSFNLEPNCKMNVIETHEKCQKYCSDSDCEVLSTNSNINDNSDIITEKGKLNTCIACGKIILSYQMKDHLDNCLNTTIKKEKNIQKVNENDVNCLSVPCPCCYQWVLESQMNYHIDECLTVTALNNGLFD